MAARRNRVQGVVTVEATVDSSGNVVDTRVLSGPIELRRAAQQSVLTWHFATDTSMNTRQVKINFELSALPEESPSAAGAARCTADGFGWPPCLRSTCKCARAGVRKGSSVRPHSKANA